MAADGGSHGNGGVNSLSIKVPTTPSPKGSSKSGGAGDGTGTAHCLCSPTTHPGSFRCRFHRARSSSWMRRSKSMSAAKPAVAATAGATQKPA